jgi:hypothetical protein
MVQLMLDILYFPIWWFSAGLFGVARYLWERFQDGRMRLAPGLWLKNLFVPMYGQRDWQGRLMSVFMRFVNVIGRSIFLIMWIFFLVILLSVWTVFPFFVLSQF